MWCLNTYLKSCLLDFSGGGILRHYDNLLNDLTFIKLTPAGHLLPAPQPLLCGQTIQHTETFIIIMELSTTFRPSLNTQHLKPVSAGIGCDLLCKSVCRGRCSCLCCNSQAESGQSRPIVASPESVTLAKVLTNSQIGVQLKLSGPYYGH